MHNPEHNLYRAKRVDEDIWVVGWYFRYEDGTHFIKSSDDFKDYPIKIETLMRFTGWYDRSGTPIFEGDICTGNVVIPVNYLFNSNVYKEEERLTLKGVFIIQWSELTGSFTRFIIRLFNSKGEIRPNLINKEIPMVQMFGNGIVVNNRGEDHHVIGNIVDDQEEIAKFTSERFDLERLRVMRLDVINSYIEDKDIYQFDVLIIKPGAISRPLGFPMARTLKIYGIDSVNGKRRTYTNHDGIYFLPNVRIVSMEVTMENYIILRFGSKVRVRDTVTMEVRDAASYEDTLV